MALATLSIDLEARLGKLEEGMSKATRVAEKNAAAIEARYARIGTAVRSVAGVIAGAFAGISIAGFLRDTITGIDALNDLKDATGASIENLSALEDVALRTGTSMDSVSTTLVRLNNALNDATPGSRFATIFKAIGLDAAQLRAIDPAEALRQVAVALSKYADDQNKARMVQELFGKSIREAAPLLNDLAKQTGLVGTLTSEQAERAERFNQQLSALGKTATDLGRSLAIRLLPALNDFAAAVRDSVKDGDALLVTLSRLAAYSPAVTLGKSFAATLPSSTELQRLQALIAGLENVQTREPNNAANNRRLESLREQVRLIEEANKKLTLPDLGAGAGRGSVFPEFARPSLPGLLDETRKKQAADIDEATRSLAQYVAGLDRERIATQELSEEQQALVFLKQLGKRGEIPQVRELVLGLAAQVDQMRDTAQWRKLNADAQDELNKREAEGRKGLDALLAQTASARGAQLAEVTARLDEAFQRGSIGARQYAEAVELVDKALTEMTPEVKKAQQDMDEFSKQAARNIQDALGDAVLASLQGRFDTIGRLWGELIQRMIAQALSARLGEILLGSFARTGSVGGLFGDFLGLFGLAKGGAFARGGALQPFATGGVVSKPTLFRFAGGTGLMGEAGEEAILPLKRGRDGKLGVAAAGGGPAIVINQYVDGGMNRSEVYAAMAMLRDSMRAEVRQSLRAAGIA